VAGRTVAIGEPIEKEPGALVSVAGGRHNSRLFPSSSFLVLFPSLAGASRGRVSASELRATP